MVKKLLKGIVVILLLFGICAGLEKQTTPDGSAPMTEQLITETVNVFSEAFGQIKDGFSQMFSSIAENFSKDDEVNVEIGEVSVDQLPDEAQEYYKRYVNDNWETTSKELEGRTQAGEDFNNNPKKGETKLPEQTSDGSKITYKEFDAETTPSGKGRGKKRFVHGSDGSTYYTDDHYKTFRKVQ